MKKIFQASVLAICSVCLLFVSACTDPLDVGTELLSGDQASVGFTDTIKIQAKTIKGDSVRAFAPTATPLHNYLFGRYQDEFFGVAEAAVYLEPLLLRDAGGQFVEFKQREGAIIDSIVLVLPLDSSAVFGQVNTSFGIDVWELDEKIDNELDDNGILAFYSNSSFDTKPTPLASTSITPNFDSVFVKNVINSINSNVLTVLKRPHLRVPLDPAIGQAFLDQDSTVYKNDSTFQEYFKGLYMQPNADSEGLLDFSLSINNWAGIYVYYQQGGDTLSYNFELGTIGKRINQYKHDYTASMVGDFLDDTTKGDSLLFLQGMEGLLVELSIPELSNLAGKVINKAELEFTVAVPDDYDLDTYPAVGQIIALTKDDKGVLTFLEDVAVLSNDLDAYFGGHDVEAEDGSITYNMNLSLHLQGLLEGTEPDEIYLAIVPRPGNANRVILKGAASSEQPAILKISYTDL